jgi:hypothetical protein
MKDPAKRSLLPIEREDLERLRDLVRSDREEFFRKHPDWAELYESRVLGSALCQGGASHYIDGVTGINDFDLYTFYAHHPARVWYAKRMRQVDFGDPKFGRSEVTKPSFIGRRVDLQGRAIKCAPDTDPAVAIRRYLRRPRSTTARFLAEKAVVLLEPDERLGEVVWPPG